MNATFPASEPAASRMQPTFGWWASRIATVETRSSSTAPMPRSVHGGYCGQLE
jgi:hypothetical protein